MFTDKPESYRGVYSLLLTPFKEDKSITMSTRSMSSGRSREEPIICSQSAAAPR